MKDFPLNELIPATELSKTTKAIVSILSHLKKIKGSKYPLGRTLKLIEAISKDLTNQLLKVLSTQRLMAISFDDFEKTMKSCFAVFTAWDDEYEKLQAMLRDFAKRKRDEFKMVWRINPSHKRLQTRLVVMQSFRRQHDQLRLVISRVLRPSVTVSQSESAEDAPSLQRTNSVDAVLDVADANAIEEVSLAYEKVKEVDALDISEEGQELWEAAIRRYDERIERVEARMTARLRDQLGTAKNANEMFRIFSRFNALFVRPHIRGAIREYQTQLIQRVKDDIEALQEKFKAQYIQSKSYRMSKIRDIPPVAGSIIWAKQIERQLNMYMGRVEDVLGKGWETHVDGQKLKADGDSFRIKLNTQELFEDWSRKVNQKNLQNSGRIFLVDNVRASKGSIYTLKVNFSPEIITLTKEARNMKWLVSRVPLAIVNKAHTARQMYPYAISLIENVSTYKRICERVNEKRTCQLLVAGMKKDIQNLIMDMSNLVWDSYKLESSVQKFSDSIYNFREKVDELVSVETTIEQQLKELDSCSYNETKFAEILYEIQKSIDYLNLKGFSNLPQWVIKLDEEVEKKFAQRLTIAIKVWVEVLIGKKNDKSDDDTVVIRRGGNKVCIRNEEVFKES
jgi:dynein heavy chain 1